MMDVPRRHALSSYGGRDVVPQYIGDIITSGYLPNDHVEAEEQPSAQGDVPLLKLTPDLIPPSHLLREAIRRAVRGQVALAELFVDERRDDHVVGMVDGLQTQTVQVAGRM
jgi:hypothetical protein